MNIDTDSIWAYGLRTLLTLSPEFDRLREISLGYIEGTAAAAVVLSLASETLLLFILISFL